MYGGYESRGSTGRNAGEADSNGKLLAHLAAEMEALRAENARLASTIMSLSGSVPAAAAEEPAGAPRKQFGDMRIWVGSWNMGAKDPFLEINVQREQEAVSRLLTPFIPRGYDLYVLGIQEGISDKVFEAVESFTKTFRLPLNAKLYPAREHAKEMGKGVRSRRMGQAIPVQAFINDAKEGILPDVVASTGDMLDRVWGRGDGALLTPKFTGIAVFVSPVVAPYCRLLGVYKHSFGASEGSKGGVGVALGLYNVNVVFVNAHMASKKPDLRRAQYAELVDRLGAKLGGRGFGLNEEFHHVVWMGDLNYHCKGVSAREAVALIASNNHMQLLLDHDELLDDKENELAFYEYEEPLMAPSFFPTYKKIPARGQVNYKSSTWVDSVYMTKFKEPFYKGGREVDRVPSWTDRIQYHSLSDRSGELLPEPLDPEHPDTSLHNYQAVNDGLDVSDHSPIYATFTLQICAEEVDAAVAEAIEGMQSQMGYKHGGVDADGSDDRADDAGSVATIARPLGPLSDADLAALHPSLRPLEVILSLRHIVVEYRGAMRSPRAVNVLFPLPYEDSNAIPDRTKVVRMGTLFSSIGGVAASESRESLTAILPPCLVSRASKLESLHLLLKVSLDDNTKAQCVLCMKDGGFIGAGSHVNTFLLPLTANGLPLKDATGKRVQVQFELKMEAYERGGTMAKPVGAMVSRRNVMAGAEHGTPFSPGGRVPTSASLASPYLASPPYGGVSRRPVADGVMGSPAPRGAAYPRATPGAAPAAANSNVMASPHYPRPGMVPPRASPLRSPVSGTPTPIVRSVAAYTASGGGSADPRQAQALAAKARAAARVAGTKSTPRGPVPHASPGYKAPSTPLETHYINDEDE